MIGLEGKHAAYAPIAGYRERIEVASDGYSHIVSGNSSDYSDYSSALEKMCGYSWAADAIERGRGVTITRHPSKDTKNPFYFVVCGLYEKEDTKELATFEREGVEELLRLLFTPEGPVIGESTLTPEQISGITDQVYQGLTLLVTTRTPIQTIFPC